MIRENPNEVARVLKSQKSGSNLSPLQVGAIAGATAVGSRIIMDHLKGDKVLRDQVEKLEVKEGEKIAWLSQTTLSVDETLETVHALKNKLPLLMDPPSDDICYATQNRQDAVTSIAFGAKAACRISSAKVSTGLISSRWAGACCIPCPGGRQIT